MIFDPLYIAFMVPALLVGLWAQFKLSSTYNRYIRIGTSSGVTGAQAAREILDHAGLHNVPVEQTPGHLTDHYDPRRRALVLSSENYQGHSLAAVGVAAHEAGHALQHQAAYAPLNIRMAMVPLTQIASYAWMGILMLGLIMGMTKLVWVAIGIFSIIAMFQLITLPVEFDASRRAKEKLLQLGIVHSGESEGVSKVLGAAALTYVAAMISAVMTLLYWLNVARSRD
jgi:uncharacterized protein